MLNHNLWSVWLFECDNCVPVVCLMVRSDGQLDSTSNSSSSVAGWVTPSLLTGRAIGAVLYRKLPISSTHPCVPTNQPSVSALLVRACRSGPRVTLLCKTSLSISRSLPRFDLNGSLCFRPVLLKIPRRLTIQDTLTNLKVVSPATLQQ